MKENNENVENSVIASATPTVIASAAPQSHDTRQCPEQGDYYGNAVAFPRNDIIYQYGRSMIEMLGVLAIIGVLSVGGIMGYSKAMFRYKVNKTIEQITYIAGNVRTTFASQGNYVGLTSSCPANSNNCIAKKAKLFPDDMWKTGETYPKHAWEDYVVTYSDKKNSTDTASQKAFRIYYGNIPEEACIELITHDWKNAQVKVIGVANRSCNGYCNGTFYYFLPPATIDNAIKICARDSYNNSYWMDFYFEVDTSDSFWKDQIDSTTAALAGS